VFQQERDGATRAGARQRTRVRAGEDGQSRVADRGVAETLLRAQGSRRLGPESPSQNLRTGQQGRAGGQPDGIARGGVAAAGRGEVFQHVGGQGRAAAGAVRGEFLDRLFA
jgi:hypothetical protein